jgi:hypothetical protein
MSPSSVILEIAFARLPTNGEETAADIWDQLDEQHLPTALRRRLEANGIRCGLVGLHLPESLRERLPRPDGNPDAAPDRATAATVPSQQRRLQTRAGQRSEIVTSLTHAELAVMFRDQGRVRGEWLDEAQCLLGVKTLPDVDGRVTLELTPEIQYGQPEQQWVGRDGMFRLEAGRKRRVYEPLRIAATLAPGQSLLLTCTPEGKGLGRHFFTETVSGTRQQKVLLVRLAQTQHDDLFAPPPTDSPLLAGAAGRK